MVKKLGFLFAFMLVVGIVNIVSSPKENSREILNSNIRTALRYLEQDIVSIEQGSDARPSLDRLEYELLFGDTPPNPFLEPEYAYPDFLQTYELYPTSLYYDPSRSVVSWLPWDKFHEVPPGSLILGPYVEPCPELLTGVLGVKVARVKLNE